MGGRDSTDTSPEGMEPAAPRVELLPAQLLYLRAQPSEQEAAADYPSIVLFEALTPVDTRALAATLAFLVERHEALRACLRMVDGRWIQEIGAVTTPAIQSCTAGTVDAALDAIWLDACGPWNLAEPTKVRCIVAECAGRCLVALVVHHVVSDAFSSSVLRHEVQLVYEAFARGEAPALPPVYTSFSEWAAASADASAREPSPPELRARLAELVARGPLPLKARVSRMRRVTPTGDYRVWLPKVLECCTSVLIEQLGIEDIQTMQHGRSVPGRQLSRTVGPLYTHDLESFSDDPAAPPQKFSTTQVLAATDLLPIAERQIVWSRSALVNPVLGNSARSLGGSLVPSDEPTMGALLRTIGKANAKSPVPTPTADSEPWVNGYTYWELRPTGDMLLLILTSHLPSFSVAVADEVERRVSAVFSSA